jgi:hypothetical protein
MKQVLKDASLGGRVHLGSLRDGGDLEILRILLLCLFGEKVFFELRSRVSHYEG